MNKDFDTLMNAAAMAVIGIGTLVTSLFYRLAHYLRKIRKSKQSGCGRERNGGMFQNSFVTISAMFLLACMIVGFAGYLLTTAFTWIARGVRAIVKQLRL